jgi:hypothetical protein
MSIIRCCYSIQETSSGLGYSLDEQVQAIMLKYFKFKLHLNIEELWNNTTFKYLFELSAIL